MRKLGYGCFSSGLSAFGGVMSLWVGAGLSSVLSAGSGPSAGAVSLAGGAGSVSFAGAAGSACFAGAGSFAGAAGSL